MELYCLPILNLSKYLFNRYLLKRGAEGYVPLLFYLLGNWEMSGEL